MCDSVGSLIIAGNKKVKRKWSILALEALTVKEGLKSYLNHTSCKALPVVVESDSITLIKLLNKQYFVLSEAKNVVDDIEDLARETTTFDFRWCPRSSNWAAHSLAINARNSPSTDSQSR